MSVKTTLKYVGNTRSASTLRAATTVSALMGSEIFLRMSPLLGLMDSALVSVQMDIFTTDCKRHP